MLLEMLVGLGTGALFLALCAWLMAQLWRSRLEAVRDWVGWAVLVSGVGGGLIGLVVGATYGRLGLAPVLGGGVTTALLWLLLAVSGGVLVWWISKRDIHGHSPHNAWGAALFVLYLLGALGLTFFPVVVAGFLIAWVIEVVCGS